MPVSKRDSVDRVRDALEDAGLYDPHPDLVEALAEVVDGHPTDRIDWQAKALQTMAERDEARAEVERLREALSEIASMPMYHPEHRERRMVDIANAALDKDRYGAED